MVIQKLLSLLIIIVAGFLPVAAVQANDANTLDRPVFRMGCLGDLSYDHFRYAESIYRPLLASLGYHLELIGMSTEETIRQLNDNTLDGECGRTKFFFTGENRSYVKIDHAIHQLYLASWVASSKLTENRDKPRRQMRVGYSRQIYSIRDSISGMGFGSVTALESRSEGLAALVAGRIDTWIDYDTGFGAKTDGALGENVEVQNVLRTEPIYPVLASHRLSMMEEIEAILPDFQERAASNFELYPPVQSQQTSFDSNVQFACHLAPDVPLRRRLESSLSQSFATLGYGFDMATMPTAREEQELLSGRIDGSCARGPAFFKNHPTQVVKVDFTIGGVEYQLWTNKSIEKELTLEQLIAGEYSIGFARGATVLEELLHEVPDHRKIRHNSPRDALKFLAANRMDVLIEYKESIETSLAMLSIDRPLYMNSVIFRMEVNPALRVGLESIANPLAEAMQMVY